MGFGIKTACTRALRRALFERGYHYCEKTSAEDLCSLMRRLRPMDCGMELIRVGCERDGGYLIPDDLEGIEYCFSPGVDTQSEFESQLADRGIRSFLADCSVEGPAIDRAEFTFDKMHLGAADGGEFFTLETWKEKYLPGYSGELMLQMDIEGAEFEVIQSTPLRLLDQFRIVTIEFHKMSRLFDAFSYRQIAACLDKLLMVFEVVHIHPNNFESVLSRDGLEIPNSMEFTFLNKRRVKQTRPCLRFPHELDRDNEATMRPIVLHRCWYADR